MLNSRHYKQDKKNIPTTTLTSQLLRTSVREVPISNRQDSPARCDQHKLVPSTYLFSSKSHRATKAIDKSKSTSWTEDQTCVLPWLAPLVIPVEIGFRVDVELVVSWLIKYRGLTLYRVEEVLVRMLVRSEIWSIIISLAVI